MKNLPNPYGECISGWRYKYFNQVSYSPSKCKMDKKTAYITERCGCKDFYMPSKASKKFCSTDEYHKCIKVKESKCTFTKKTSLTEFRHKMRSGDLLAY